MIIKQIGILFHNDATNHTSSIAKTGAELLELFPNLKKNYRGKLFSSHNDKIYAVTQWF